MSLRTRWLGTEGAAFERVCLAFEALGYRRPSKPEGSDGDYAANVSAQYIADMTENEALAVVKWALASSILAIKYTDLTEQEIFGMYGGQEK